MARPPVGVRMAVGMGVDEILSWVYQEVQLEEMGLAASKR